MSNLENDKAYGGRGIPISSTPSNTGTGGYASSQYSKPIIFHDDEMFKTSEVYKTQSSDWCLINDVIQDGNHIKSKGTIYLPKEPREEDSTYCIRLQRSFFKPVFKDETRSLLSRPFSQPISVTGDDFNPGIEAIKNNADLMGNDLTSFFRDVMLSSMRFGHCHVLVDYPVLPDNISVAERKRINPRPNFKLIPAYDLINFETFNTVSGQVIISQATIKEVINIDGQNVQHMRVYNIDSWQLYRKDENEDWMLVDEGQHTFGAVPILTYYTNKTGMMESEPPLKSVAELNILHYNSLSDQRNILHHARVPLLFMKGVNDEETDFAISVNNLITSTNESAGLEYVEHNGAGIDSGWLDLEKIESSMKFLLGQPLTEQAVDVTATSAFIREARSSSQMMAWTLSLTLFVDRCYRLAAQWLETEIPEDFSIDIFTSWVSAGRTEDISFLNGLYDKQIISRKTLIEEYKRRAILPNSYSIEVEDQRLADENRSGGNNPE